MKIGNFETENNVFLAPMAGVTDLPFRKNMPKIRCRTCVFGNGECERTVLQR